MSETAITNARYNIKGSISVDFGGERVSFRPPKDLENYDPEEHWRWHELVTQGITPADYVAPAATWDSVRAKRNSLLTATDWQASSDRTMSDAETTYRQALRDLPSTNSDPTKIVFPDAP
jgi:hypothetical protein